MVTENEWSGEVIATQRFPTANVRHVIVTGPVEVAKPGDVHVIRSEGPPVFRPEHRKGMTTPWS